MGWIANQTEQIVKERTGYALYLSAALGGELVIDRVVLEDADIRLLRTAYGLTSWTPGTVEVVPEEATELDDVEFVLPTIRELRFENTRVLVNDELADTEGKLDIQASGSTLPDQTPMMIALDLDVDSLGAIETLLGTEVPDVELASLSGTLRTDGSEGEIAGPVLSSESLPIDLLFEKVQGAVELRVDELAYTAEPVDTSGSLGAKLDLEISRVQVARFVPDIELIDDIGGPLGGRVELWASGDSVASLAGSLDGGVLLLLGTGQLDAALVELAGIDLFQVMGDFLKPGEDEFGLRCAYASLHADSGTVSIDDFVIDSAVTEFLADGIVDLEAETPELRFEPHPKEPS